MLTAGARAPVRCGVGGRGRDSLVGVLQAVLDTTPHSGPGWGCITRGHGRGCQHTMQEVGKEKGGSLNANIHAVTQCHGSK